jgi:hypothetical protein
MGVGQHLKRILARFGIRSSATCSCNAYARQMDEWGPDGCASRMPEILKWLEAQARGRKLIFSAFAARQLVLLAIRRAKWDEKSARKGIGSVHKNSTGTP